VPSEDPIALAAAIDDVLSGRRATDLVAARRYALRFELARVVAEYAAAYRELTAEPEAEADATDSSEDDRLDELAAVSA
jgi:hypothetical protein